jgi:4-hydroxy-4-methyl-2-oxoglutarate aldolase
MTNKMDDAELIRVLKEDLFTAVVGDVLDAMGFRKQFLPQAIGPLVTRSRIAGRAMPVLEADVFDDVGAEGKGPLSRTPFGIMFEALDDLKQDEIYIASGSSFNYALWGGLMSTRAQHLKAGGAILNGFIRDADEIERLGFPVFSRGVYAQDQGVRGKVIDFRTPIEIEGIRVTPGDLIFADREGVLIIPREAEQEAIARAIEKNNTENAVAVAIRNGMSTRDAFDTFGVM